MENKKYHTVATVLKSNRKTKNTTLSQQFHNSIEKQKYTVTLVLGHIVCKDNYLPLVWNVGSLSDMFFSVLFYNILM